MHYNESALVAQESERLVLLSGAAYNNSHSFFGFDMDIAYIVSAEKKLADTINE